MKAIKKIICPVDVYDFQPEAAEYAQTLAIALGAEIFLVYVMEPLPTRFMGDGYAVSLNDYEEHEKEAKQKAEAKLAKIIALFVNGCQVDGEVLRGQAADKIIQAAGEHSADMIAMVSHGRSFWGRAIHGSVTSKVLANAKIPVLVINPQE